MDGLIIVDKPAGWTSHDVVNRMRRLANTKKVGHLGTLDPMATGVLPLVIGRATRLAQFFEQTGKVYDAVIKFGFATDTYDAEGKPLSEPNSVSLDRAALETALVKFTGKFEQIPPPVSAKKIAGTPAYKLARQNISVALPPVPVEVFSIEVLDVSGDEASIRIHCGSGTYVRSVAHDTGILLGCGAHLKSLRRTASSGFEIGLARTLDQLNDLASEGRLSEALIPSAQLLPEFPCEFVDSTTIVFIRQGRDFRVSPFHATPGVRYVKAVSSEGDLVAIGEAKLPHLYHPILVM
jgi:tRNA pseudouridine55 synthase